MLWDEEALAKFSLAGGNTYVQAKFASHLSIHLGILLKLSKICLHIDAGKREET